MNLEEKLAAVPAERWKGKEVYSFDWHDGPREGVCSLADPPAEFYFELLDERYNPDGLDDRLFRLSELPSGSVAEVLAAAPDLASLQEVARKRAKEKLQLIQARKRPTSLILYSHDMTQFLGCWNVLDMKKDQFKWFSILDIPLKPSA